MKDKCLHIIAFDVPFPPDYGGAMDVFYRIKALHELGVKIILHCYEYGRGRPAELKDLVEEIHYYKRRKKMSDWLNPLPFIVKSRSSQALLRSLLKDDHPILFEGLHSTYFLSDPRLKSRIKLVRTHNIEHEYYKDLSETKRGVNRIYFSSEALKLNRYESVLEDANYILAIKESDRKHFLQYNPQVYVLPPSLPSISEIAFRKTEEFCLFHGNLSVPENTEGASWLINHVFRPLNLAHKFVVAGKNPDKALEKLCVQNGITLVASPEEGELSELIEHARIHVFYSDQPSGVKLKLMRALQTSGHVIVNPKMVEGTDLSKICTLATTSTEFQNLIREKLATELRESDYAERQLFIQDNLNTLDNCREIILPLLQFPSDNR